MEYLALIAAAAAAAAAIKAKELVLKPVPVRKK
jgi:hypothetical protein